jgi:uncharacterized protein (DUF305 family)
MPGTHPPWPRNGDSDIDYAGDVPSLTARLGGILAASLLLSSCGRSPSADHASSPGSDEKPIITGEPAGYNAADVGFASNTTTREEQGVNLSRLVPDRSRDSELVVFSVKTGTALQGDTQVLKPLQAQWKEGQDNPSGQDGPTVTTTAAMIDDATVAKLNSLQGPKFDTLWLNSMIGLDQGTIVLANAEVTNGKNVDAVSLAKQIVKARQGEISQMQHMLAR